MESIHAVRQPRLLVAVDHEGGRVQRFRDGFTHLPAVRRLGEIYDHARLRAKQLARVTGWLMATELRAVGVDFSFAPVLDLDRGVSAVIGDRSFHSDPEVVADLAHAYVTGMQKGGMEAVGKHFPGHGGVTADSHLELPVDERFLEELATEDLLAFERLIHYGLAAIMPAHVLYPQVDDRPAGFSPVWLKTILRRAAGLPGGDLQRRSGYGGRPCGRFAARAGRGGAGGRLRYGAGLQRPAGGHRHPGRSQACPGPGFPVTADSAAWPGPADAGADARQFDLATGGTARPGLRRLPFTGDGDLTAIMTTITAEQAQAVLRQAEVLCSAQAVTAALERLAAAITARLRDCNPLLLAVMNGGMIPTVWLLGRLDFPLQIGYVHATRYRGTTQGGELRLACAPPTAGGRPGGAGDRRYFRRGRHPQGDRGAVAAGRRPHSLQRRAGGQTA